MEQEIIKRLEEQEVKLNQIYSSMEKLKKYFLWTLIITVVTVVLPVIGLIIAIPWFLKIMTSAYSL